MLFRSYSIYVLYLGLPVLMKVPKDKAAGYTAVSVICAIVLSIVMGVVISSVVGLTALSSGSLSAITQKHSQSDSTENAEATTAALKQLSKFAEKMEAAQKESQAQTSNDVAAENTESAETPLPEAAQITVLSAAKMKALLPESVAGLKRISISSEKSSASGYEITKAQAQYSDGATAVINLTVGDYGSNINGGFFSWLEGEVDNESALGYEKTGIVDGRQTHETSAPNNVVSEYSLVVADRFVVESIGQNVGVDKLKAAINTLGLDNLEALKNEGVK